MTNKIEHLDLRWDLFFQPLPLAALAIAIILTYLAWILWKKGEKNDFIIGPKELDASDQNLILFYGWAPLILGIHLAIPLLVNGIQGRLFTSTNPLEGALSNWLGLTEIMIALSLFYGGLTRPAAALMGFLWFFGLDILGVRSMLECIQYLGFAFFFYLAGRGPYSIDRILFPKLEPSTAYANYALFFLRVAVGLNFVVYGITQKLANIPQVSSLLEHSSFLNFTSVPNEIFILFAGAFEILAGLLIVFGIFPRITIILTLICINASLTISNWNELVDYLPTYGALALLLVWEPHNPSQKLLWVQGLRKNMDNSI